MLLDVGSERYYRLKDAGRFVWRLLEEPRSFVEIRDRLVATYRVEPERAERDLSPFLERLVEHDLVRIRKRP